MSISVYIGHTGQRLALDPSANSSVDALRSWLAARAAIAPRNQILLTAQGKQVRAQTLLTETELFVFDSSWLGGGGSSSNKSPAAADDRGKDDGSSGGDGGDDGTGDNESNNNSSSNNNRDEPSTTTTTTTTTTSDFKPGPAPDTIADQTDLHAWEDLFRARKSWAAALLNGCGSRARQAAQLRQEKDVIERSLAVAVASLQQHVRNAEKQCAASEAWADELLQEQAAHVDRWEANLDSLRRVPGRADFVRFILPVGGSGVSAGNPAAVARRNSQQAILATLQGFVDVAGVRKAAGLAKASLTAFRNRVAKMRQDLDTAAADSNELLRAVELLSSQSMAESASEPSQLVEEIGMVVKKMASDLEHVESLPRTQQSVSQASKMALLHTRNYLPNLADYCAEMNELVRRNLQQRAASADLALEHMRTLSSIESQLATLFADIKQLEVPDEQQLAFVTLSAISRLPSVYGQLMVESVRRREWVAKMKRDSSTLQEEVATYQEEEEKRRKKWVRTVEDVVSPEALQSRVLGIELSLQNEGDSWPMTTRDELHEYLRMLLEVYGQGPVTSEIDSAIKELDKPTRKQIKHAKAFKNGSIHEAAFGDTSLLLRGDDQNKSLRETNTRLEEELRAQRSRVRKLEDLLYRQTQMGRASTGDMFAPQGGDTLLPPRPGTSPRTSTPHAMDDASRNSSLSRPRGMSAAQAPSFEEKRLAKRVVDLETELQSFKAEEITRKNSDADAQKQVEEAMSTKRDLMQNMEAQQREFADERRTLERELADTKERIEELENEIERIIGSRDGADDEIARLKEDAAGHAARAATAQDARAVLERKLEQAEDTRAKAEEEVQRLRLELEQVREANVEPLQMLTTAHAQLTHDSATPTDLLGLATALEELSRRSAAHAKDLEEAVAFAKSENESLWASNERQKTELSALAQRQTDAEEQARQAEEKLATETAKAKSLEEQLNEEQGQLRLLRNKFADGETGSEVLRQRVSDEEAKARSLSSELAEAKSHINSLDVELMRLQKKQKSQYAAADAASERLQKRADRAKDVSQKLYSQNARLGRLLERLGLAVSYQDDNMVIERASKLAASTVMSEIPGQLSRTTSLASQPLTKITSTADPETALDLSLLHWPDASAADEELARYEAFARHIARFDLDVFADAVTKRVKDFEYTAKKYSKEAKEATKRADAYKERAVKLRSEAHAKLAVRDFKDGDLALFLPTRGGQVKGAWAAFNIGCPHYFLAEREGMRLGTRDFIVARIQRVEQKVVDLGGQQQQQQQQQQRSGTAADRRSLDEQSDAPSSMAVEDDNPFDLSDGLTWWLVHAVEERGAGGAPTTPGLGKSTVAAANVDAKGSIRIKRGSKGDDASRHLNKSLDSRRSSSASKKGGGSGAVNSPVVAAAHDGTLRPPSFVEQQQQQSGGNSLPPRTLVASSSSGLGIRGTTSPDHRPASPSSAAVAASQTRALPHPPPLLTTPATTATNDQTSRNQLRNPNVDSSSNYSHGKMDDDAAAAAEEEDDTDNAGNQLMFSRVPPAATAAMRTRSSDAVPTSSTAAGPQRRTDSPSKSVRSLQRHLEQPASPAKTRPGWESLWSAEFSVESGAAKGEKR